MSRTLSSGNNLSHAAAVLTAVPFTMACWFKLSTLAAAQTLMSIDAGNNQNRFMMDVVVTTGVIRSHVTAANQSNAASTTAGASTGSWNHACAVQASATSRAAYLNGGNKGTNTTSRTATGLNTTLIGLFSGPGNPLAGDIAECAIWNVALSDADVALLATGVNPVFVQRANLVAYWPLRGLVSPEPSIVGSFAMTVGGTPPEAVHAPVTYPQRAVNARRMAA